MSKPRNLKIPYLERFWCRVDKPGECWIWKGHLSDRGYGKFPFNGLTQRAHRIAYQLEYGVIANGVVVRHSCDNPSCVNPEHLAAGTHADNIKDKMERNRQAKGETCGRAKLNNRVVLEIRKWHSESGTTMRAAARKFNLPNNTVRHIIKRRTWKHI